MKKLTVIDYFIHKINSRSGLDAAAKELSMKRVLENLGKGGLML